VSDSENQCEPAPEERPVLAPQNPLWLYFVGGAIGFAVWVVLLYDSVTPVPFLETGMRAVSAILGFLAFWVLTVKVFRSPSLEMLLIANVGLALLLFLNKRNVYPMVQIAELTSQYRIMIEVFWGKDGTIFSTFQAFYVLYGFACYRCFGSPNQLYDSV
jgi:hypothetical protein